MANRTQKDARSVKGTNPQYLVEKIIRMRVYDSKFWKEECFALSAELLVDKAMELRFVGGVYAGNVKPSPFLCLVLKLLQIQPDKDIIIEFIRREDFKYVRALGAFYLRLTGRSEEVHKYLEPLYNDYRKLRWMGSDGKFSVVHVDEFVDRLLRDERVCDIQLPRLQKREHLEEAGLLPAKVSPLDDDLDNLSDDEEDAKPPREPERRSRDSPERRPRSSPPRRDQRDREREREREKERDRDHKDRDRRRSRSRSRDRERRERRDRIQRKGDSRKEDSSRKRGRDDSEEREVDEANALRASLGLAPLKP